MEKLTIAHLAPYLIHKLFVQYTGILNVTELSKWDKKYRHHDDFDEIGEERPSEVIGLKVGKVKRVNYYDKQIEVIVGVRRPAKVFYEHRLNFKPILRPLSDLTKEITHKGETFVPTKKLDSEFGDDFLESLLDWLPVVTNIEMAPYVIVEKLCEWHFDVFGLIPAGHAVSVDSLTDNPYEKL